VSIGADVPPGNPVITAQLRLFAHGGSFQATSTQ
jgi:hypothetical protein